MFIWPKQKFCLSLQGDGYSRTTVWFCLWHAVCLCMFYETQRCMNTVYVYDNVCCVHSWLCAKSLGRFCCFVVVIVFPPPVSLFVNAFVYQEVDNILYKKFFFLSLSLIFQTFAETLFHLCFRCSCIIHFVTFNIRSALFISSSHSHRKCNN